MTSSKSTKRALLTSVLALLMCVTMLVGATFAWFTDTASTGVNKIVSGNLHVEIQDKTGEKIENLEWVKENGDVIANQEGILWEPGCTYLLTPFQIVNTGNLALKYKIVITGLDGDSPLLDVIKFTYKTASGAEFDMSAEGHLAANGGSTGMITVSAHMDKAAGNKYQEKTLTGVEFTVIATQDTVESDSFGNTYDKHAKYPDVAYTQASTQDELNTALNNPTDANGNPTSKIAVDLKKGSYTLPGDKMGNKEISITGTKDTVIDLTSGTAAHNASITMEGVKVKSTNGNYTGIQHAAATIFKDCVIEGQPFLYAKDAQYINCTFNQTSSDAYNVWTYGAGNVLFKDCTFKCAGKSVLIYNEGSINGQTVEFKNCKFNASAPVTGKAAIEIDSSLLGNGIYTVIIDQATANNVTGFGTGSVSNSTVWNNKKGTKATVIVAGSIVLSAS